MKSYEDTLERNASYWKETDRNSYIALYKGQRLNTKQIAYLRPVEAMKAVGVILKNTSGERYLENGYFDQTQDISAWVKQAVKDSIIEIVALEDLNTDDDGYRFEASIGEYYEKSKVEPMVLCENYNEYFNAQINN